MMYQHHLMKCKAESSEVMWRNITWWNVCSTCWGRWQTSDHVTSSTNQITVTHFCCILLMSLRVCSGLILWWCRSDSLSLIRSLIRHQNTAQACCHGDQRSVPDSDLVEAERHLVITLPLCCSPGISTWHHLSSHLLHHHLLPSFYSLQCVCSLKLPPPPPPLVSL